MADVNKTDPYRCLQDVANESGIVDNEEQLMALHMIGGHFIECEEEQLLLYIAGIGGSGKSHIINAVVELFDRCGASDKLLLSAPTGAAAVLIRGYTIHALTFLPKS
ncbi:hypothetical protein BJ138DRAFT_1013451, partial [Hygrophoropsis aurantiaca]